jgi:hypothetical protein
MRPGVTARAQPVVPVSYPRRVVCSQNINSERAFMRLSLPRSCSGCRVDGTWGARPGDWKGSNRVAFSATRSRTSRSRLESQPGSGLRFGRLSRTLDLIEERTRARFGG